MSVQYFAKVKSPEDHAAFQRIVKHYPSCTYEEWLFREQKKMSDWKSRRHAIKLVEITPAEFEAYCKKTGKPSDLTTFLTSARRFGRNKDGRPVAEPPALNLATTVAA